MRRLLLLGIALVFAAAPAFATVKAAPETAPPGVQASSPQPGAPPSQPEARAPAHEPGAGEASKPEGGSGHEAAGHAAQGGEARAANIEHEAGEAEAAESPWATVARLFNFALLAGILIYLLRSPLGAFLEDRRLQIRKQLTDAAETKAEAQRQLTEIEQKMKALPAELESLKQRGAAEIAAEEARIREAAEHERGRMLENAKREIERRTQVAERQLVQRAGELAVGVATARVKQTITDEDQRRLIDRYLEQVRPETIGS